MLLGLLYHLLRKITIGEDSAILTIILNRAYFL
ncbi:hypothetical protein EXT58_22130 [Pectobacterium carotovorum subsp. carotovorum]|uniref:Uncharacterized protein n=1 Tax=Treponema denticola (strain ATCC 35405 / DSM 14222 / CIP 103919 / JCM 8153 / KCTC 15104) TaxID=243275 RepID=Q73J52_TREDE|nr:hypothetical protein TDE_2724 [Treponema denticola ATCC 35405]MCL6345200.1 hypothetical protein [Pectobacterium carotovorum subsp. carotovorum]HCY96518.1 hypothetical protein [Treponema sp.]